MSQQAAEPGFWDDADVVYVYTREQAIEDGVLIDARQGELEEVTRQHFPGPCPVVMTSGLYELIRRAVENRGAGNDWRGVWHDVLWMFRVSGARRGALDRMGDRCGFRVIITGTGRRRLHTVVGVFDGEALTFMLPHED